MSSVVCVLLLNLVLLDVFFCEGCWKQEREALLGLNSAHFNNGFHWVDSTNCCKWKGVECNTTTGRVVKLDLSGARYLVEEVEWHLNFSDFIVFKDLKNLNLAYNNIDGCVQHEVFETLSLKLVDLEVLDIIYNIKLNSILPSLRGFKSLKELNLASTGLDFQLNVEGISKLKALEILDLSGNQLNDSILWSQEEFAWPKHLQVLILDGNSFSNDFLSSLSGLQYLESRYLSSNKFEGSLNISIILSLSNLKVLDFKLNNITNFITQKDWFGLKELQELDISYNKFEGPLPPCFANFSSLRQLKLSGNNFIGNIASGLASLVLLEDLRFQDNQFEVPISLTPFANHSNLKFIYGHGNKVILDLDSTLVTRVPKFQLQVLSLSSTTKSISLPLPNFLFYQHNLTELDCIGCRLEGKFPTWLLENNTEMTDLILRNCSFTGTFSLPTRPLLSLVEIDLSDNLITGQIPDNNISSILPVLDILNMSVNAIHGSIPSTLGQMILLDLSNNHLSGEIPKNMSSLNFLSLSNNKLQGPLFPILAMDQLDTLFLDGNCFSGNIPSNIFNKSMDVMDISNNFLVGKLPSVVGNQTRIAALSLSNNHLEGSIPVNFFENSDFLYLDISHNKLTGHLPSFVGSRVEWIYLSSNSLRTLSKRMFSNNSSIVFLDLRYNKITSSIHDLMQDLRYTSLSFLLLKGNDFTGHIPKQLCQLTNLTILDLSYNNFNGSIPSCLGKMHFGNEGPNSAIRNYRHEPVDVYKRSETDKPLALKEKAEFTTKNRSYVYMIDMLIYMNAIDLSCNRFSGNIPSELGNLTKLHGLNLSHNYLTGEIPATFSNLAQIESLDLSFNNLSGNIPPQLSKLTFLAVFTVAHNNLSGSTPDRKGQFSTFDESSYEDNPFLCGPPLPKSCADFVGQPNASYTDGLNSLVDMYVFCVSFVVSYASVLLAIAVILFINPHWRQAWFYYLESVMTNCYYFIEDNLPKFSNIANI